MHLAEWYEFWLGSLRLVVRGSRTYWLWVVFLLALIAMGLFAYADQARNGLIVTAMRDQVMWGFYIGNFTFLVGVAAAAVVLVIPAYVYSWGPIKEIVIIGELLAVSALVMCMSFVTVDLGNPLRAWHLMPMLGSLNFPSSILAWDVVVLTCYLLLNFVVVTHLVYRAFHGREATKAFVIPLVLLSIPAAVSIHTVTAFLYNGLAARPFWNSAILAPRFLASAFCSGPAIILILLQILRRTAGLRIRDEAIHKIAELMAYAVVINLFLLIAEVFKEFYSDTHHLLHMRFLFFGLEGGHSLAVYAWSSILCTVVAAVLFLIPATRRNFVTMNIGCVLLYVGVYIEKGIGLVIPGLTPDVLGEIYDYSPSFRELQVAAGVFGLGFLVFTLMIKVAIPVVMGKLRYSGAQAPAASVPIDKKPEFTPDPASTAADIS